jgi:hypothetical protein
LCEETGVHAAPYLGSSTCLVIAAKSMQQAGYDALLPEVINLLATHSPLPARVVVERQRVDCYEVTAQCKLSFHGTARALCILRMPIKS